ncbi:MAG: hypothetical protein H6720_10860 [Sandaracinus sp.]|nr:hypothetical protein [Sandaracinus sp.]
MDWRLGGFLSRHLRAGRLTGEIGECVLAPTGGRLSFDKVVLVGLGPHEAFGPETFESSSRSLVEALRAAHVRTALVALPGRAERRIEAADAIERFLRTLSDAAEPDEITLVETIEGQKEMEPVLAREQRRARAFAS